MEEAGKILQGLNLESPTTDNILVKCARAGCNSLVEPEISKICPECKAGFDSKKRMPLKLASVRFNSPYFDNPNDVNLDKFHKFFGNKVSYYIYGSQGVGKTWLAAATMNWGLELFNECWWYDWVDDILYANKEYPSDSQNDVDARVIDKIVRPKGYSERFVFIDDLGNDPERQSDRSRMMLYRLLKAAEERENIYFFFTTNQKLDYFVEMDGRIADRIVGLCTNELGEKGFIGINGVSLRDKTKRSI